MPLNGTERTSPTVGGPVRDGTGEYPAVAGAPGAVGGRLPFRATASSHTASNRAAWDLTKSGSAERNPKSGSLEEPESVGNRSAA